MEHDIPAASEPAALRAAALQLGVSLSDAQARQQLRLLDELQLWAGAYNLTSITGRAEMRTHHLLDSLAAALFLHGTRIADLGTGAGFPGLPLAIAAPEREFTLIDSTAKKIRFVSHVVRSLALTNVTPLQSRIESLPMGRPFDTLIARALAPLPALVSMVEPLCTADTRVVALKGRLPEDELTALPAGWRALRCTRVAVPGLEAERHVIVLARC